VLSPRARRPLPFGFVTIGNGAYATQQEKNAAVFEDNALELTDSISGDSIKLATEFVGRGHNLWVGLPEERNDFGIVTIQREGITEELKPLRRAVEQSWIFDTLPSGAGDLVVRCAIDGVVSAKPHPEGLELTTPNGVFLYTSIRWVDAANVVTPIVPRWTGTAVEMTVPAAIVESSEYPAVLDPLSGAPPATGTPGYAPSIASNGTDFLAVWEDYPNTNPISPRIMARRIHADASGTTLGTAFTVSTNTFAQDEPAVAYDGTNWVIAWTLRAARDRVNYARYSNGSVTTLPTLVGSEQNMGGSNGSQRHVYSPSVACRTGSVVGEKCAIAYHEVLTSGGGGVGVYFQPITDSGGPSSASSVSFSDWTYSASLATDGTTFALAWEGQSSGGSSAFIGAATFTYSNGWSRTTTSRFLLTAGAGERYSPVVTYSGSTYLLSYVEYATDESVYVRTLSTTHTMGSAQTIASPGGNVHLACASGNCLAAYYLDADLFTKTVNPATAAVGGGATLTGAAQSQENPRLAGGSARFFGVWDDRRDSYFRTYGVSLTTTGAVGTEAVVSR
jgi:hypothetical protein